MHFSMQERKKRECAQFKEELQKLESMSALELKTEFITTKTKYEHHKNILLPFLIFIVLAALMNAWKSFYDFMDQLLQMALVGQADSVKIAEIGFIVSAIVIAVVTVTVFLMLIAFVRKSSSLYRSLLMIEEAMGARSQ